MAPASTGGSAVTDYVIQRSPNGTTGWVDDQRRRPHDDDVHRHRAGQRHPLLLPGLRPQRCRLQPDQRRDERHPANSAWSATQSRGVRRLRGLLAAVGRSSEQWIADHRLHRPVLEPRQRVGDLSRRCLNWRQRRSSHSPGSAATTSESLRATPPASAPSARSVAASWRSDRSARRRPNGRSAVSAALAQRSSGRSTHAQKCRSGGRSERRHVDGPAHPHLRPPTRILGCWCCQAVSGVRIVAPRSQAA